MNQIVYILTLCLFLTACTKEVVTKIVSDGPNTTQSGEPEAVEGTINGGGGKGVLCQKNGQSVVETLDLYEARVLYDREIVPAVATKDEGLDLFASLIAKHYWNPDTIPMPEYKENLRKGIGEGFLSGMRFIDSGKKLKLVNDSFEPLIEENCKLVQVAVYYDESIILVDKSLWDKMDWLNRVALLAHEAIYYMDRQNGSTNSLSSRKLVGQLFSTKGARPKTDGVPADDAKRAECRVNNNGVPVGYFYAYDSQRTAYEETQSGLELVFNYLKNNSVMFRTSAFLNNISLDKMKAGLSSVPAQSDLFVDTYPEKKSLKLEFNTGTTGKLYILEKAQGTLSEPLDFTCELPRDNTK